MGFWRRAVWLRAPVESVESTWRTLLNDRYPWTQTSSCHASHTPDGLVLKHTHTHTHSQRQTHSQWTWHRAVRSYFALADQISVKTPAPDLLRDGGGEFKSCLHFFFTAAMKNQSSLFLFTLFPSHVLPVCFSIRLLGYWHAQRFRPRGCCCAWILKSSLYCRHMLCLRHVISC